MTAQEIYEKETGNKCPSNQIAFCEWHLGYVVWLEKRVESYSLIKIDFQTILKRKLLYYGKTEAAYEFAAEEYANKLISYAKR